MKHLLASSILTILLTAFNAAHAQDVSRAEFEALLKRVQMLEQQLKEAQAAPDIDAIASEVAARTAAPKATEQKTGIIDSVINVMQSRQEAAHHPWMDAEKWDQIKKGMTSEAVVQILGKPYTDEPSLRKRIDNVYTYRGRRVATNKRVEAKVKFYKNKVVDIEEPEL
ncbi:MAG: outer membrane protein assembly factor BamE domain-containing protein [Opitutales bacterium]